MKTYRIKSHRGGPPIIVRATDEEQARVKAMAVLWADRAWPYAWMGAYQGYGLDVEEINHADN